MARVHGPVSGNVLLRREQYRRADDPAASAAFARACVVAKIANARTVLLRSLRDHPDNPKAAELQSAADRMARIPDRLREGTLLDEVRGCEGDASRIYFEVFDHLVVAQKEDFFFKERSRRPPLDVHRPFRRDRLVVLEKALLEQDLHLRLRGLGEVDVIREISGNLRNLCAAPRGSHARGIPFLGLLVQSLDVEMWA